jgi:DNA-binding response OmpR family regulator
MTPLVRLCTFVVGLNLHGKTCHRSGMASILIVKDEAPIAGLLSDHLTRRGHAVTVAADGEEAFNCLGIGATIRRPMPDLVVLDVMLPGRTGLEVCAALRQGSVLRQPVVLMLTAKRNEEDAIAGFEAGADDYVRKPFGVSELVRRIDAAPRAREPHPFGPARDRSDDRHCGTRRTRR